MESIYTTKFDNAISLGMDCRVRYQLSLSRYKRALDGEFVVRNFEHELYAAARVTQPEGTYPFDWWVTPFSSLLKCIERDFDGLFERKSLEIHSNGQVRDVQYQIFFPHAFSHKDGPVTPEVLENEYEAQHRKLHYLLEKFRAQLRQDKRVLYVAAGGSLDQARQLSSMLARTQPRAHVLSVQSGEATTGVSHEEEGVTIYVMDREVKKQPMARWQGDDEHWGKLLDRINFG